MKTIIVFNWRREGHGFDQNTQDPNANGDGLEGKQEWLEVKIERKPIDAWLPLTSNPCKPITLN